MFNFSVSFIFFWIKARVDVDTTALNVRTPNLLLGFIPSGRTSQNVSINTISNPKVHSKISFIPLLIGIILLAWGIFEMMGNGMILGIILAIIGILIGISAFQSALSYDANGKTHEVIAPFFQKSSLEDIRKSIQTQLDELSKVAAAKTDDNSKQFLEDL
ncbi:hypothetical protein [Pediococcus claussenii]|uniref:Uncharacterized protein n=1 Tax=Pediococcus claussenii (strain ATCC BAA-344 / DSM 14800 / JCM 18046 / KCTC 3811 / LMG 21948 / P06) TaxID=701521 RepID=G8PB21_PEDCP|nr:hypothetical protein [Pediococcus claussenii]AEV94650.1 hypothetical protein PECL_339 [Pediococcus claussenii ATCC BAA-344]ANZ69852.1 hypothetical protein AYR57_05815 [Pediococcus claussenii]ANZ71669.1 hypothetical protein AYR58_05820 [Pediococcus claussenii]KRN20830.1 hypothetical protein IV79_GL000050 [Pediococcus claussenii]